MKNHEYLQQCSMCPRNCKVNRYSQNLGVCRASDKVKIARVSLHHWEEPPISGKSGSGTIFFSNCNLKCVFCQNHEISHKGHGEEVSIERLSEIFIEQQKRGAHNINLVTPSHYALQIKEAIILAKNNGLSIPILYNSNGYENLDTIKALNGYIDVYLPDLKYYDDKYALKYSSAPMYFKTASEAIKLMYSQVGPIEFDENRMIKKGVVIRHLMLPGLLFDSKKVIDFIFKTFNHDVYISLMNQYMPMYNAFQFKELSKPLNPKIYDALIDYCVELGIKNAFIQDSGTNSESFVPEFDLRGI
ncbi:radical SAM protein [Hathewaya histolytica]|uniref:Radical SAM protein n=1 Tax=Hathewaya histolytica TaxID=1498 RepID=A0A4U9RWN7_HATHI|nr:radical SAM protein [Hathewaya histolytica]VTQ95523.1 radical SAM protein [Hathewaya histolytica]